MVRKNYVSDSLEAVGDFVIDHGMKFLTGGCIAALVGMVCFGQAQPAPHFRRPRGDCIVEHWQATSDVDAYHYTWYDAFSETCRDHRTYCEFSNTGKLDYFKKYDCEGELVESRGGFQQEEFTRENLKYCTELMTWVKRHPMVEPRYD